MPFDQVGSFIAELRTRRSTAARALEFTILTAARTSETLKATWAEIDLEKKLWIIPAQRMKAGKEHRVPLSDAAVAVLAHMTFLGCEPASHVFPGTLEAKPLSNMSMEMLLRRMDADDYTVHGFRSSFRDGAGEMTEVPREVAEAALAHSVGSEVERSYRRGDALDKRRDLMAAWAEYLAGRPPSRPDRRTAGSDFRAAEVRP